jgi:hypothetical protein
MPSSTLSSSTLSSTLAYDATGAGAAAAAICIGAAMTGAAATAAAWESKLRRTLKWKLPICSFERNQQKRRTLEYRVGTVKKLRGGDREMPGSVDDLICAAVW